MSVNAILFDNDGNFYVNDRMPPPGSGEVGTGISPVDLGVDIMLSLSEGSDTTEFGLKVSYAIEMLKITGETGRFFDCLDNTEDHRFNPDYPTPSGNWGAANALREKASRIESLVSSACDKADGQATLFADAAADLRERAHELEIEAESIADDDTYDHLMKAAKELRREANKLERSIERVRANLSGCAHSGSQTLAADNLRAEADRLENKRNGSNPLAKFFSVPKAKFAHPHQHCDAAWYDHKTDTFRFGGYVLGWTKLGRVWANAVMRGESVVTIGDDIAVHTDLLIQMATEAGRTGEFGIVLE